MALRSPQSIITFISLRPGASLVMPQDQRPPIHRIGGRKRVAGKNHPHRFGIIIGQPYDGSRLDPIGQADGDFIEVQLKFSRDAREEKEEANRQGQRLDKNKGRVAQQAHQMVLREAQLHLRNPQSATP